MSNGTSAKHQIPVVFRLRIERPAAPGDAQDLRRFHPAAHPAHRVFVPELQQPLDREFGERLKAQIPELAVPEILAELGGEFVHAVFGVRIQNFTRLFWGNVLSFERVILLVEGCRLKVERSKSGF